MENKNEAFSYTYSAKQQEEIKAIRNRYLPKEKEEDKMERLRRLDESATRPGMITALAFGIIGCLILGVGMCCCLVWKGPLFLPGILIGIVGIIGISLAYPLYTHITKKQREKIAPEILRLTDELMK